MVEYLRRSEVAPIWSLWVSLTGCWYMYIAWFDAAIGISSENEAVATLYLQRKNAGHVHVLLESRVQTRNKMYVYTSDIRIQQTGMTQK